MAYRVSPVAYGQALLFRCTPGRTLPGPPAHVTTQAMALWRNPFFPVGLFLVVLGLSNWYTGRDKSVEYEQLLLAGKLPAPTQHFAEFPELNAHTTATLLRPLQRGNDAQTLVGTKLDFYRVVQSGGRMLVLVGLFCAAAGLIHSYRQRTSNESRPSTAET